MATKTCSGCGKRIGDKARTCPSCGQPQPERGLGLVVLILQVVGFGMLAVYLAKLALAL
jgi:hypothetical protein